MSSTLEANLRCREILNGASQLPGLEDVTFWQTSSAGAIRASRLSRLDDLHLNETMGRGHVQCFRIIRIGGDR
jgi:hypothetical protein